MPRSYGENETPVASCLRATAVRRLDGTSPRGASSLFDRGEPNGRAAAPPISPANRSRAGKKPSTASDTTPNKRQVDRRRHLHELG